MTALRRVVARNDGLSQVAVVLAAIGCYELARTAMAPNWPLALAHARSVVSWERVAHVDWEEPIQRAFLGMPHVVQALNVFYFAGHFVLTTVFFVWLYRRSRPAYRTFRNGFISTGLAALLVHWRFPTAPPRLADVGLVDTLNRFSGIDIGSPGSDALSNPVAAVPSLHAGFALGVGIGVVLYARSVLCRAAGAVYPVAVVLTVIVTGNHFVLDAVAGMLVLGLGFAFTALVLERRLVDLAPATRGGAVR